MLFRRNKSTRFVLPAAAVCSLPVRTFPVSDTVRYVLAVSSLRRVTRGRSRLTVSVTPAFFFSRPAAGGGRPKV
jgi:hypothetical protein